MTHALWAIIAWLLGVALLLLAIRFGAGALLVAKRPVPGAGAVGWALVFLSSGGRMPPPPPASQIEAELNGEKDRASSDPLCTPPGS